MKIERLILENFGSHARTEVSFSNGINAIIGENGAGKTTLLEAIAYALYPRSFGRHEDLMRTGAPKMRVQLEFEMDGRRYLLLRERSREGLSSAALYDVTDGKKLLQRDQSKVNSQIEALLGISREIFLQAVYVRQGEIAQLLDETPSKRRELIGKLLGIEVLEKIWDELREVISRIDSEIQSLEGEIRGIGDIFKERASLESQKEDLQREMRELSRQVEVLSEGMEGLKRSISEMEKLDSRYKELKAKEDSLREILDNLTRQLELKRKQLDEFNRELESMENLEDKASKYEDLDRLRKLVMEAKSIEERVSYIERLRKELEYYEKEVASLNELKDEVEELSEELKMLELDRERLIELKERLNQLISTRNHLYGKIDEKKARLKEYLSDLSSLLGTGIESPENGENLLKREVSRLEGILGNIDAEIFNLRERLSKLVEHREQASRYLKDLEGNVDTCPLCGSKLDPGSLMRLKEDLMEEVRRSSDEISELVDEIRRLEKRKEEIESRYRKLSTFDITASLMINGEIESMKGELVKIEGEVLSLEKELRILEERVLPLNAARKRLEELKRELIEKESIARKIPGLRKELEGTNLEDLKKGLIAIKNDLRDGLATLNVELSSLDEKYRESLSALKELQRLKGLLSARDDLRSEINDLEERARDIRMELSSLKQEIEGLSYNPKDLERLKRELNEKEEAYNSLSRKMSWINGKLEEIEDRLSKVVERESKLRELIGRKERLESFRSKIVKVREIFSKDKGIQPLLRERARPSIEEELNAIFSSFNFDYDSVMLDDDFTPSLRRGKTIYSFSRLSGGEKISLALALRLAIARFLMMSRVETFLLDEPTVHLDEDRINALVETMASLNVPQMIVVTHSPRFRDVASHSIIVSKSEETSSVEVVDEDDRVSD